ncbi:MAG TPA: CpsD/CapB family tyrosine-protein kinase, partial [Nitrospirales bacterium]|nr:CpsD/CapB family tyrosine-protein kinase [Nitrospirales bacterium]
MSKVFEALQYAYDKRELEKKEQRSDFPSVISTYTPSYTPSFTSPLPALEMQDEMARMRQSISSLLPPPGRNIIQFISSGKGEGTSLIVREFGMLLAKQNNKSVLLVDTCPGHADQHQAFHVEPKIPLESTIRHGGSLDLSISRIPHPQQSLSLCFLSENHDSNSSTSWLSRDMVPWEPVQKQFDYILIDSPPISSSHDGLALCSLVDGVVLVMEAVHSRSHVVQSSRDKLIESGGNILGIAFNKQKRYIPDWIYRRL